MPLVLVLALFENIWTALYRRDKHDVVSTSLDSTSLTSRTARNTSDGEIQIWKGVLGVDLYDRDNPTADFLQETRLLNLLRREHHAVSEPLSSTLPLSLSAVPESGSLDMECDITSSDALV